MPQYVVCLSVRPSVGPSVCNVQVCDHSSENNFALHNFLNNRVYSLV